MSAESLLDLDHFPLFVEKSRRRSEIIDGQSKGRLKSAPLNFKTREGVHFAEIFFFFFFGFFSVFLAFFSGHFFVCVCLWHLASLMTSSSSFSFLTAEERVSLGSSLQLIEERDNECRGNRSLSTAPLPPPPHPAVPQLQELDGAAVAADPGLLAPFIRDAVPVMIRGYTRHLHWPANDRWAGKDQFVTAHGNVPFKLTELAPLFSGAKPLPLRLPLAVYARYAEHNQSDFPWYQ